MKGNGGYFARNFQVACTTFERPFPTRVLSASSAASSSLRANTCLTSSPTKPTEMAYYGNGNRRYGGGPRFERDQEGYVVVYTDGACSSNGQMGARAGIGIFWGDDHELNVSQPVEGRATNNNAEIEAAIFAINQAAANGLRKLAIHTDSKFLIDSVTKWMKGWKQNGWRTASGQPVRNQQEFRELDQAMRQLDHVKWVFVEAHSGDYGNGKADKFARDGAMRANYGY